MRNIAKATRNIANATQNIANAMQNFALDYKYQKYILSERKKRCIALCSCAQLHRAVMQLCTVMQVFFHIY